MMTGVTHARIDLMFGFGKNNATIDEFAATLVVDLVKRFPVEKQQELGGRKIKPARKLGKAVADLERRVAEFQQDKGLGIYGKARLLNKIKWQLKELGYSNAFVDATTTTLATAFGVKKG